MLNFSANRWSLSEILAKWKAAERYIEFDMFVYTLCALCFAAGRFALTFLRPITEFNHSIYIYFGGESARFLETFSSTTFFSECKLYFPTKIDDLVFEWVSIRIGSLLCINYIVARLQSNSTRLLMNCVSREACKSIRALFLPIMADEICSQLIEINRLIDNNFLFGNSFVFYAYSWLLAVSCANIYRKFKHNIFNQFVYLRRWGTKSKRYRFICQKAIVCNVYNNENYTHRSRLPKQASCRRARK